MPSYEYNPLDYDNLTRNCVQELMRRGPYDLDVGSFGGAGVYALFYRGPLKLYSPIRSSDAKWPIYVGKAVPPGSRKGAKSSGSISALYDRLKQHRASIASVEDLKPQDFLCRYLVVTPLWITMAERFLIEYYHPLWNVCIEGFGIHNPGKGRHQGQRSWWDVLHPGRSWATKLVVSRTKAEAERRAKDFLAHNRPGVSMPHLKEPPDRFMEDEDNDA